MAVELNDTVVPPKKTAMTGVSRLNVPVAFTVTVLPIVLGTGQVAGPLPVLQVRVMSAGVTVTTEPFDSRTARQITMFVSVAHGWPAW